MDYWFLMQKDAEKLDSSYQEFKRLFVLAYDNEIGGNQVFLDSFKKNFLSIVKIEGFNIETDGRNFYDLSINNSINYKTGCLLNFAYFQKYYRLIAVDLSKQKAFDADSKVFQQIIFTGKIKAAVANTRITIYYIVEKSKETTLKFSKGKTKVL